MSTEAGSGQVEQRATGPRDVVLHRAAIGLGSNMGDRIGHIERALLEMSTYGLRLLSVSRLYETKPMYYTDQDPFINGVCYIETSLSPHGLLDALQAIENRSGRVRKIDKGPRTLDLDILLYDDVRMVDERLEIPHRLILEREFVLRPLVDVLPEYHFPVAFSNDDTSASSVRVALARIRDPSAPMHPVTTLRSNSPLITADDPRRTTQLMSILNITPDSFSDGGLLSVTDLPQVQDTVRRHIEAGITIIDIGGQSTRPKAERISAPEELKRVLPVLESIRSMPEADNVAISVDTYYAKVAAETIKRGADIINDISAGLLDPDMLSTVAGLGKTIVLMHMRGNPRTMTQLTEYPDGVLNGVAHEIEGRVKAARDAGIHPWRIILDPGIGFAKTHLQNLELLRGLERLRATPAFGGMPWLLGVSRKGFIGKVTSVKQAEQRAWGTAAAVTASIAGGADIVRVHDVSEMAQVTKMADAIYRSRFDSKAPS